MDREVDGMTPYQDVLSTCASRRDNGTVTLVYVDQSRAALDPTHRVWQESASSQEQRALGERRLHARGSVARFPLAGPISRSKAAARLSERCGRPPAPPSTAHDVGQNRALAARERERTMTTITLKALLEALLGMQGTFVLRNAHGSLEFKGQDLYLSSYQEWLTVYHATPQNPHSIAFSGSPLSSSR
jgi:hypothetical protein